MGVPTPEGVPRPTQEVYEGFGFNFGVGLWGVVALMGVLCQRSIRGSDSTLVLVSSV